MNRRSISKFATLACAAAAGWMGCLLADASSWTSKAFGGGQPVAGAAEPQQPIAEADSPTSTAWLQERLAELARRPNRFRTEEIVQEALARYKRLKDPQVWVLCTWVARHGGEYERFDLMGALRRSNINELWCVHVGVEAVSAIEAKESRGHVHLTVLHLARIVRPSRDATAARLFRIAESHPDIIVSMHAGMAIRGLDMPLWGRALEAAKLLPKLDDPCSSFASELVTFYLEDVGMAERARWEEPELKADREPLALAHEAALRFARGVPDEPTCRYLLRCLNKTLDPDHR